MTGQKSPRVSQHRRTVALMVDIVRDKGDFAWLDSLVEGFVDATDRLMAAWPNDDAAFDRAMADLGELVAERRSP